MTASRPRILFVDDEPLVLAGLRNSLRRHRSVWDMVFATGGAAAMSELERGGVAVVVSDLRMPEVDGVTVIERCRELDPATIRIVLSGYGDEVQLARVFGAAHQLLEKPIDTPALARILSRACAVHERVRAAESTCLALPPPPRLYFDIVAASAYPVIPLGDVVAELVTTGALHQRLLGLISRVGLDPSNIANLDLDTLAPLVLAAHVWAQVGGDDAFFDRAVAVAEAAVSRLSSRRQFAEAFTAALVHDLGTLLGEGASNERVAAVGACTLARWSISLPVIEAVARQHEEAADDAPILFALIAARRAAHVAHNGADA